MKVLALSGSLRAASISFAFSRLATALATGALRHVQPAFLARLRFIDKKRVLLLALGVAAMVPVGQACSCAALKGAPAEQVEQSLADANEVFVARVLRSSVGPDRERRRLVAEIAHLKVLEVFKGSLRVGQIIVVNQVISAGSCGQSSLNDPPWLFAQRQPGASPEPLKVSRKWLVYAYGAEPYELSRCTRSAPLNAGGEEDVKLLRARARNR